MARRGRPGGRGPCAAREGLVVTRPAGHGLGLQILPLVESV